MSKKRPTYTEEFRRDDVELLRASGKPLSQIVDDSFSGPSWFQFSLLELGLVWLTFDINAITLKVWLN